MGAITMSWGITAYIYVEEKKEPKLMKKKRSKR